MRCAAAVREEPPCFSKLQREQFADHQPPIDDSACLACHPGCNKQTGHILQLICVSFETHQYSVEERSPRTMASRQQPDENAQEGGAAPVTTPHTNIVAGTLPLELETRWPPRPLRRYGGGFWLAEVVGAEGLPAVHSSFVPRPSDVILASFLKSGTTWLKSLAFATLKRSTHLPSDEDHPLRHLVPHDCVKSLELLGMMNAWDELDTLPSPRLLATHLPCSMLPGSVTGDGERSGCRMVYLYREPKDVLVSFWLFARKLAQEWGADVQSFTIQEASELFCQGRCPYGPHWQHVLQYWKESLRRPDRLLLLKYEEMLLEPESHVNKLARFMGCEFSEEEEKGGVVSAIVELCSLRKLKDMEVNRNGSTIFRVKNESFFRKGVVGDWINHMTPEIAQRIDRVVEDALKGTGFTFASTA